MIPLGLLADGEQGLVVDIRNGKPEKGAEAGAAACCAHTGKGCHTGAAHTVETGAHGSCAQEGHMEDMGIRPGREVEMLRNSGRGPILLKVDEARIAIGRGMAMKIFVRRKDPR